MIVLIFLISFLLDGILLSSIDINTICYPLFTLSSLIISYSIFMNEKRKYLIVSGILGFFYDVCYANTLFFHFLFFIGIAYLIPIIFDRLSINVMNSYLVGILTIILYRIFLCLFFVVFGFSNWNIEIFYKSILSSIIINSIYLVLFYFIVKKIRKNLKKKKYELLKVKKVEQ